MYSLRLLLLSYSYTHIIIDVLTVMTAYYGVSCSNDTQLLGQYLSIYSICKKPMYTCDGKKSCSGYVNINIIKTSGSTGWYPRCLKDFFVVAKCSSGQLVGDRVEGEAQGKTFSLACKINENCETTNNHIL